MRNIVLMSIFSVSEIFASGMNSLKVLFVLPSYIEPYYIFSFE
jgi:hypothetical protein